MNSNIWKSAKLPPLLLLVGVFLIYGQSVGFGFIALDDSKHIWANPYVSNLSWKNLQFFWHQPYYGLYIPLLYNIWSLLAELTQWMNLTHPISGFDANFFHLFNVCIHFLNVYIVYNLLVLILIRQNIEFKDKIAWTAFFAAGVFAFHPLQVESVAWASGSKDVVSTFFALTAVVIFLKTHLDSLQLSGKERKEFAIYKKEWPPLLQGYSIKRPLAGTTISVTLFLFSLLSKPNTVSLPLILFFILLMVFNLDFKNSFKKTLPFFLTSVPIIYITKSLQPNVRLEFDSEIWQIPLIALHSLGFYVSKVLLPLSLAPDYGLSPPVALQSNLFWPLTFLGLAVVSLGLWTFYKKKKLALAFAIFIGGLAPVLGVIPFEYQNMSTVADRYMYFLPMFGVALAVTSIFQKWHFKQGFIFFSIASLILISISFRQTQLWSDNQSLFARALEINPASYLAYNNLGLEQLRSEHYEKSEKLFKKALQIKPEYLAAQSNLGVVYFKRKQYDKVIEHYSTVLKDETNISAGSSAIYADMHYNWGAALLNSGNIQSSIQHLEKAVEINVNHFAAQFHRGRIYAHLGQYDKAKLAFYQAYRLNPNSAEVMQELKKLR